MHPSYEVKREYMARIHGDVDEAMIKRLTDGVILGVWRILHLSKRKRKGDDRNTAYKRHLCVYFRRSFTCNHASKI